MKKLFLVLLAIGLTGTACKKNGLIFPKTDPSETSPQIMPSSSLDWEWTEITTNMFDDSY